MFKTERPPVLGSPSTGLDSREIPAIIPHDFQRSYRDQSLIANASLAIAPVNPSYTKWRDAHVDPVKDYRQLRPEESAFDQRLIFVEYLIKNKTPADQLQICIALAQNFSPIITPRSAWLSFPPLVRTPPQNFAGSAAPSYVRAEIKWKGEWVGDSQIARLKPWQQLEYTARIHSNSRDTKGEPPSIIIQRSYVATSPAAGRIATEERLLASTPETLALAGFAHANPVETRISKVECEM
jgi:hypothetical protein